MLICKRQRDAVRFQSRHKFHHPFHFFRFDFWKSLTKKLNLLFSCYYNSPYNYAPNSNRDVQWGAVKTTLCWSIEPDSKQYSSFFLSSLPMLLQHECLFSSEQKHKSNNYYYCYYHYHYYYYYYFIITTTIIY